jgi:flagellar protein FliS
MAKIQDYHLRIVNASPVELVIINYDIIIEDIQTAVASHGSNPAVYIENVNSARDALAELIGALDGENPVSKEIYPIYEYINTLLMSALIYEKKSSLDEAMHILVTLRDGWIKARECEPPEAAGFRIMGNSTKVYTGLTYGRKGADDYIDTDPNSGIKA